MRPSDTALHATNGAFMSVGSVELTHTITPAWGPGDPVTHRGQQPAAPTPAAPAHAKVTIQYLDENFQEKTETYDGMAARIIQHEYDHIEGILFTDRIHPLKRNMLKKKLQNISYGIVNAPYKMKFPKK
jgi:hypothetical protein